MCLNAVWTERSSQAVPVEPSHPIRCVVLITVLITVLSTVLITVLIRQNKGYKGPVSLCRRQGGIPGARQP
jgi:hypothetical protein